ncbi:hypothetical protein CWATWH0402_6036 [Crocosphaera watsonii WH 0402]|uniref:Uncharacterized protein n=2 Tax=Crocosphaera watsonii TaxID=263511 RepID=T2JSI7_CROWT|nr:hypothetical protein CWATWH0005_1387 [Crocosphaera watsonii WH 0005]CCQ67557.1 hypothetical protein CWATWH0402_6036 [Crocosphaera watsonii WH 0402]
MDKPEKLIKWYILKNYNSFEIFRISSSILNIAISYQL